MLPTDKVLIYRDNVEIGVMTIDRLFEYLDWYRKNKEYEKQAKDDNPDYPLVTSK